MDGMKKPTEQAIDLALQCVDCLKTFTFTAGEQAYYASKSLTQPKRCPKCREVRRQSIVPDQGVSRE